MPRVCHVPTPERITKHTDQSEVDTWQWVTCGPIRWRHVSIFATWHVTSGSKQRRPISDWHVSYVPRGSPVHSRRTFHGCCGNPPTRPPATTHPGVFGKFPGYSEVPRVFRKVPGTFGEVPGVFGKFQVFLESSRVFLGSSPGVLGSSGTFSEVPGCFRRLSSFGTQKTRFAILRLQKKQIQSKNS